MIVLSLIYLIITVVLPGIGTALSISILRKKSFMLQEFLAVASAASLFILLQLWGLFGQLLTHTIRYQTSILIIGSIRIIGFLHHSNWEYTQIHTDLDFLHSYLLGTVYRTLIYMRYLNTFFLFCIFQF